MADTEHHVFSFIIDGVQLSDEQKATISKAVGQAGIAALAQTKQRTEYVVLPFLPKYRGIPAVSLAKYLNMPLGQVVSTVEKGSELH